MVDEGGRFKLACASAAADNEPHPGALPVLNGDSRSSSDATPIAARLANEPQLPILRFGLRQFFWWVTAACVLLAVLVVMPRGMSLIALLLAIGVVTLHVLSTAIGTRLRDHADERRIWESGQAPAAPASPRADGPIRRSPLHGREQPLRRMRICLTIGAITGGTLGMVALSILLAERTTIAGILVGAASMAVLGAWIAFLAASAWSIFRQGWRDAVNHDRRPQD
jgi:hypothetical protein